MISVLRFLPFKTSVARGLGCWNVGFGRSEGGCECDAFCAGPGKFTTSRWQKARSILDLARRAPAHYYLGSPDRTPCRQDGPGSQPQALPPKPAIRSLASELYSHQTELVQTPKIPKDIQRPFSGNVLYPNTVTPLLPTLGWFHEANFWDLSMQRKFNAIHLWVT